MSPERKVELIRRDGKQCGRLHIKKYAPIADRLRITAKFFSVDINDIVNVLEDVRGVLLDHKDIVLSDEQREKNLGRKFDNYFVGQLRDLGISVAHSNHLVFGVVDHLALSEAPRETEVWWGARSKMLDKLRQKIS